MIFSKTWVRAPTKFSLYMERYGRAPFTDAACPTGTLLPRRGPRLARRSVPRQLRLPGPRVRGATDPSPRSRARPGKHDHRRGGCRSASAPSRPTAVSPPAAYTNDGSRHRSAVDEPAEPAQSRRGRPQCRARRTPGAEPGSADIAPRPGSPRTSRGWGHTASNARRTPTAAAAVRGRRRGAREAHSRRA